VALPKSPIDIQLRFMWRLLRPAFWLSWSPRCPTRWPTFSAAIWRSHW